MDELYVTVKSLIKKMQDYGQSSVEVDFSTISRIYQLICLFKQIRDIAEWGEKAYE